MSKPLRVLIVEDSEDDALLVIRALKKGGYDPEYVRVETAQAMSDALREKSWDIILCDYKMPSFSGINAIALLAQTNIAIPLIIVSGTIGEETAVECMRSGAHDYIMKGNLSRLVPAIERELDEAKSRVERRRAEEALQESEALFRKLFENHAAVKLLIDADTGNIVDANIAAESFYGWSKEELKKMNIQDINTLPPEKVKEEIEKVRKDNKVHFEFRHRRADGSIRDVDVFSSNIEIKGQNFLHSVVHDITERKQAEEEIRRISAIQNLILENSTMGIALVRNSTFEWVNARVGELLMLPLEQIQGFSTSVIYPSVEISEEMGSKAYPILARGERSETVLQLRRSNGTLFWCRFIGKALNPAKPQDGSIWMFEDITERKKAQDELQKKNLELAAAYEELKNKQNMVIQQEKMASIGMLAAGITHELKNPLSIVLQGIDYLQTAGMDDSLMIEVVERMNKALLRADVIVKGLLSYARQEVLSLTRQDIPALIDDSLELIEYELHKKNLQVITQYAPDLPGVIVDGNQIKQVFVNVLMNGIDAMPPKGTFTISVRQIKDAAGKNALQISFKDTGHGIPAEKIKNIFDPFFTTKVVGNTGLGLSISKGIIDSHGGRIYAESESEQGANFIIELPVYRET